MVIMTNVTTPGRRFEKSWAGVIARATFAGVILVAGAVHYSHATGALAAVVAVAALVSIYQWQRRQTLVVTDAGLSIGSNRQSTQVARRDIYYLCTAYEKEQSTGQGFIVDASINAARAVFRVVRGENKRYSTSLIVYPKGSTPVKVDEYINSVSRGELIVAAINEHSDECFPFAKSNESLVYERELLAFREIECVVVGDEVEVFR